MTRSNDPDSGDCDDPHKAKPSPGGQRGDDSFGCIVLYINIGSLVIPGKDPGLRAGLPPLVVHIKVDGEPSTPWTRLRKRGAVVASAVIMSSITVILEAFDLTPWA